MSHSLDVELFILEVKKYPEIWDLNCEEHRHKTIKQHAWTKIARVFIEDFDDLPESEKLEIYRKLFGKWRNIRDSYVRHLKKKYGKRGYIYAKHLTFLTNIYSQHSQSGSDGEADETWQSENEETKTKINFKKPEGIKIDDLIWTSDAEDSQPLVEPRKRKRTSKRGSEFEYVDSTFPETATCAFPNEDEDRSFFESLLPAVRGFDIDQKLEFRCQVIKLVKTFRSSGRKFKIDTADAYED